MLPSSVLLTGYSGFLGRHLARALKQQGVYVRVLLHRSTVLKSQFEEDADEVIWGSMANAETVRRAVSGMDAVVHSAWSPSSRNGVYPAANESGTSLLLHESVEAGVKRFAFISSVVVYGMSNKSGKPLRESTPLANVDESAYTREKLNTEKILRSKKQSQTKWAVFRPGPIFDETKAPMKKVLTLGGRRLAIGLGTGRNRLPYIHARDVSDAVILWLENGSHRAVFNVTPSQAPSVRECYVAWAKARGYALNTLFVPVTVARALLRFIDAMKGLVGRPPTDINFVIASATRDLTYSNAALKETLGWTDRATATANNGLRAKLHTDDKACS